MRRLEREHGADQDARLRATSRCWEDDRVRGEPRGGCLVRDLEGGYQELQRIIHPHPTISEAIPEAARAVDKWAIHA